MFKAFKKLEFSKKMAVLVLVVYAIFMFGVVILRAFFNDSVPAAELITATIAIPLVEISGYTAKSTFENVQKIIRSKVEKAIGEDATSNSPSPDKV